MYLIIVNPKAGRGRASNRANRLVAELKSRGINHELVFTTGVNCGKNLAKEFCKKAGSEIKGIIGMGGDGTIQEIAAGMADVFPLGEKIPIPLCICPAGSGNDFVMSMYKKRKKADEVFLNNLITNNFEPVDLITANGHAYLNIGNVGLDAWIVKNAEAKIDDGNLSPAERTIRFKIYKRVLDVIV